MESLPTPIQTRFALQWFERPEAKQDRAQWALLASVDGHRNIVELESFARAIGLEPSAVDSLREQGLIELVVEPEQR